MSTMRQALWHAVDLANASGHPVFIVAIRTIPRLDADSEWIGAHLDEGDIDWAVMGVRPDHDTFPEYIQVNPGGKLPDDYLSGGGR